MEFNVKTCENCKVNYQPPAYNCRKCGTRDLKDATVPSDGAIYTFSVVNMAMGDWVDKVPYLQAVVELDAGLKVATVVEGADLENVKIGQKVTFAYYTETGAPIFKAA